MAAYMRSLEKLIGRDDDIYYPAHGEPVKEPQRFVRAVMAHRRQRERQILDLLEQESQSIPTMVAVMYRGIEPRLHGAAGRSVLAHLIDLEARDRVWRDGENWAIAA
jgi:glyoxylase-like metal-dependent hydrolase (beta-lactamase superfamily II)